MQIHALCAFQMISTPVYGQSDEVGLMLRPVAGSTNKGSDTCRAPQRCPCHELLLQNHRQFLFLHDLLDD
jgi:hypothetical protein